MSKTASSAGRPPTGKVLATFTGAASGPIRFELSGPAYERLTRTVTARLASHERAESATARQGLGYDETIELEGALYPLWRGRVQTLEDLRQACRDNIPVLVSDGRGGVHGRWLIETVSDEETAHLVDGTARKHAFLVSLVAVGRRVASASVGAR